MPGPTQRSVFNLTKHSRPYANACSLYAQLILQATHKGNTRVLRVLGGRWNLCIVCAPENVHPMVCAHFAEFASNLNAGVFFARAVQKGLCILGMPRACSRGTHAIQIVIFHDPRCVFVFFFILFISGKHARLCTKFIRYCGMVSVKICLHSLIIHFSSHQRACRVFVAFSHAVGYADRAQVFVALQAAPVAASP